MFERFTNKARHVVVLAQEEARLLNHNYIGTEHILLGLLGESDSVAGVVLQGFGITRDGARVEVEELIGKGKSQPTGHIPFTPRAKKTLELSLREALAIKHNYIGTEHILLGLIREGDGVAIQIMRRHADPLEIRLAVLNALPAVDPGEQADEPEESNAPLRWLRQRLGRRVATSVGFRPDMPSAEPATRGTPAVEAALQQAAKLAGQLPVGSHHLLLAALDDENSAASWALASLGVDLDELREKLRSAKITGTSDEQPEQAGRRQMAIQVSDEILTIVATDPVIVAAGKEALRAVNERAAALAKAKSEAGKATGEETTGKEITDEEIAGAGGNQAYIQAELDKFGDAGGKKFGDAGGKSTTTTVIRGDNPYAAGLADVWLDLHATLTMLTDPTRSRHVKIAREFRLGAESTEPGSAAPESTGPAEENRPDEPDEPEAATS
jgi:ATP-dependent Clp protease ATP-binding subunit ClpA